ncbi:MAG TPA: hypothetical protein VGD89_07150 [Flavipsychrobacter sp.]
MDKITLTPEQLKELKFFIYARGFREPEVQAEILDHFACKVEEKLAKEPKLDLNTAMREAHAEFGYSGFLSIKASLDLSTRRKYKHIYWQEVKRILLSPLFLILILVLGYGVYEGSIWADVHKVYDLLGGNFVRSSIWLLMLLALIGKFITLKPSKKSNSYYMKMANSINTMPFIILWIVFPPTNPSKPEREMILRAVFFAFFVICFTIDYIASYKMLRMAEQDYKEFEEQQQQSLL